MRGAKLADAVVYLTGAGLASAAPSDTVVLDQADLLFAPHVLPVVAGATVAFRNSDAILHNAHTVSAKNRPLNRAQVGHSSFATVFRVPEPVHVVCDIHSQMSAYVVVVPNRFFAKAKANGTYAIADVPPGTYELVAWHEKYGTVTATVVVRAGSATQADVTLAGAADIAKQGGSQ